MSQQDKRVVEILYTNYKGDTQRRKILPEKIWFGATQWHPHDQWLLDAHDLGKNAVRNFAMKDIKEWTEI